MNLFNSTFITSAKVKCISHLLSTRAQVPSIAWASVKYLACHPSGYLSTRLYSNGRLRVGLCWAVCMFLVVGSCIAVNEGSPLIQPIRNNLESGARSWIIWSKTKFGVCLVFCPGVVTLGLKLFCFCLATRSKSGSGQNLLPDFIVAWEYDKGWASHTELTSCPEAAI
jgi:hypothetical protein